MLTSRWLLKDRRFARVPMAIETPKDPEPRADREALAILRSLRASPPPPRERATSPRATPRELRTRG